MTRRRVVGPQSKAPDGPFRPTRGQREYLRVRLDDSRGTTEQHARAAGIARSTLYRWMNDQAFVAWVKAQEQRAATGFCNTVLLRAKEIALGRKTKPGDAIRAIDVFMRHLPGRRDDSSDLAMRAIIQTLVRPPSVQVVVQQGVQVEAARRDGAGQEIELAAMQAGVMSLTRDVGPQIAMAPPRPAVAIADPAPETPHVNAALRELDAIETEEPPAQAPVDPWAGIRGAKVQELLLPEGDARLSP